MKAGPRSKRVVILNENPAFRVAAALFVNLLKGYAVAGAGDLGPGAPSIVADAQPDVVLLGHSVPMAASLALAKRVKEVSPATAVVLMPMFSSEPYLEALRGDIDAAVAKDRFTEQLPRVLDALFR